MNLKPQIILELNRAVLILNSIFERLENPQKKKIIEYYNTLKTINISNITLNGLQKSYLDIIGILEELRVFLKENNQTNVY